MRSFRTTTALILLLAFGAGPVVAMPPPDPVPTGGIKVLKLRPWKVTHLYRVERAYRVRTEQQAGSRPNGATIAKGTWVRIACQRYSRSSDGSRLWSGVAGGYVPDSVLKTYTDYRLKGAPTCTVPFPNHVWWNKRWTAANEYRSTEAQSPQRVPKLGTSLGTVVEDNQWVRITCQTTGQRVRGSRIWDRLAQGGYIPDSTVKTFTNDYISGLRRCGRQKPPKRPVYTALGDSYSSGLGGDGSYTSTNALTFKWEYYATEPPGRKKSCFRNLNAYSRIIDALRKPAGPFNFLACQGDTTKEVRSLQIPKMSRRSRLVTITIGGNDMGFSSVATSCVLPGGTSCADAVADHFGRQGEKLAKLGSKLDRTYWQIRKQAPYAKVIVIGYPLLMMPPDRVPECGNIDSDDARLLNRAGRRLNTTIRQAAHRHKGFHYVSLGNRFDGHGPCQRSNPAVWINPIIGFGNRKPFTFHPNLRGQREYANAILAAQPGIAR